MNIAFAYVLVFITVCIIICYLYIKIKYKFWVIQPVFHFYDIYYWFINVGIIRHELPIKNRYTNFKNINTLVFENISNNVLQEFVTLVRLNYLRNNENTFTPTIDNIVPYFVGHNASSFYSFYWEKNILLDNKHNTTIEDKKLIGVITSRPLHVEINGQCRGKKGGNFDVYYVDYLCVNKCNRRSGIAPQLIQTHEYNQSHTNKNICISLFKREEELTGIIPLTVYKTYCFNMNKWVNPGSLNANITLLTGDKQNIYYLYNFIKETNAKWDITIIPEISNIIELVVTNNIFVKMLVIDTHIQAVYIFKKTCTYITKNKELISCIASICGPTLQQCDFIKGFKIALYSIITKTKNNQFTYLIIEDISDNNCIINNICIKTHPIIVSPTAYFFYNFAYNPFISNKVFIII